MWIDLIYQRTLSSKGIPHGKGKQSRPRWGSECRTCRHNPEKLQLNPGARPPSLLVDEGLSAWPLWGVVEGEEALEPEGL